MILHRTKFILVSACLLWSLSTPALFGRQLSVYGKVLIATPAGTVELRDATIRLFVTGSQVVTAQTYSDTKGNFAFYKVRGGSYEMQVMLGNTVRKLKVGNQLRGRVLINVTSGSTRVPDIVVDSRR